MPRKSHKGKNVSPQSEKEGRASVAREVTALGKQLAETLKAVAQSEELRAVGSELTHSLKRVSEKVVDAVKSAKDSEKPGELGSQLGKVVQTGKKRGVEAGERIRVNLAAGLREIGNELTRLAKRLDE
ncbi:MAG: hypothetical protein NTX64_04135 [Elusimicrobia bacterium]|nr:hypothetical protein [Elusimicrobiota bacterium]